MDFWISSKRHKFSVRDLTENPADNQAIKVLFPVVVVAVTLLEFQESCLQKDKYWICQSSGQYAQNTGAFIKSVLVVKKPKQPAHPGLVNSFFALRVSRTLGEFAITPYYPCQFVIG